MSSTIKNTNTLSIQYNTKLFFFWLLLKILDKNEISILLLSLFAYVYDNEWTGKGNG